MRGLDRRLFVPLALLASVLSLAGCGYALAGRGSFLPERIRAIGIPIFTNTTPYFDLEQLFTARVRSELIGRGRDKILPEATGVDAGLSAQVVTTPVGPGGCTR